MQMNQGPSSEICSCRDLMLFMRQGLTSFTQSLECFPTTGKILYAEGQEAQLASSRPWQGVTMLLLLILQCLRSSFNLWWGSFFCLLVAKVGSNTVVERQAGVPSCPYYVGGHKIFLLLSRFATASFYLSSLSQVGNLWCSRELGLNHHSLINRLHNAHHKDVKIKILTAKITILLLF